MQVQIISIQAALHGRPSIVWIGDVKAKDLAEVCGGSINMEDPSAVNEALFRYFNRVDDGDGDRLADLGYNLPSLSVGDLISWDHVTYRVAGMGFEKLTDSGEYAMALTAYTLRTMSGPTKAEIERGI